MKNLLIAAFLFFNLSSFIFAQSDEDKAEAKKIALQAIDIMDKGAYDESIVLLNKAQELDPKNYNYPYEVGYAYIMKKDLKKATEAFEKVLNYEGINDQCYTMLGNVYDMDGQPEKAIEAYEKGLVKFPNSGRLHFERGVVLEVLKKFEDALVSWEKGIRVDPAYPSNYHTAAIYYNQYSTEKIWGLIYGELFVNIERGSEKTAKMSQLLFETYQSSIVIKSKKKAEVHFSKNTQMSLPSKGEEFKLPFSMPYEINMLLAATDEMKSKEISLQKLSDIRTKFIEVWFKSENGEKYPNILFDWHQKLIDLNFFEAYNYWVFMKGAPEEFDKWYAENTEKFDGFIEWFQGNPMPIDEENFFHRTQYD